MDKLNSELFKTKFNLSFLFFVINFVDAMKAAWVNRKTKNQKFQKDLLAIIIWMYFLA